MVNVGDAQDSPVVKSSHTQYSLELRQFVDINLQQNKYLNKNDCFGAICSDVDKNKGDQSQFF